MYLSPQNTLEVATNPRIGCGWHGCEAQGTSLAIFSRRIFNEAKELVFKRHLCADHLTTVRQTYLEVTETDSYHAQEQTNGV